MDKRYQVFVSSTYEDLQEERQEVMHALLELDCIPAGMELFPAANEDQWTLIKRVIDDCDYYLVIVGGRYGSTDADGMSYTEKEYRYALGKKPCIGFLHRNPDELAAKKTERVEASKEKLQQFRELVSQKVCQFWEGPADLGSKVSRSLVKLIKQHPAVGWVRADQLPSDDVNQERLALRKKVEELEGDLARAQTEAPKGTEDLAQGDDQFQMLFEFSKHDGDFDFDGESHRAKAMARWNEIFYAVSPRMMDEASEGELTSELSTFIEARTRPNVQNQFKGKVLKKFRISSDTFHTVLVQLRALGLISKSVRNRSVKDTQTYWKLTPYGDTAMTRLRAIRRDATEAPRQ